MPSAAPVELIVSIVGVAVMMTVPVFAVEVPLLSHEPDERIVLPSRVSVPSITTSCASALPELVLSGRYVFPSLM